MPFAARSALSRPFRKKRQPPPQVVGNSHIIVTDKITGGEADVQAEDLIVEKDGRMFVDVARALPDGLDGGRKVVKIEMDETRVEVCVRKHAGQGGHDSKSFVLNRFLELDEFFFETLGLWEGEGGKDKGLYFGNNCLELLQHFLKFSEERLGINRKTFKVTINTPNRKNSYDGIKRAWSERLSIPIENFTDVCIDERINAEYAQVYVNGIVLSELMNNLHEKMKAVILSKRLFSAAYIRGFIAAEGSVHLKKSGVVSHVAISNKDMCCIEFCKSILNFLGIEFGKYMEDRAAFPIYGRRNHDKLLKMRICDLHPDKILKLKNGMNKYQRYILDGDKMESMIIAQLDSGPKTYDDIAHALKKGRSTIQSHYIPILESKRLIKRVGKRKQACLFALV